jgi:hypothetical protein
VKLPLASILLAIAVPAAPAETDPVAEADAKTLKEAGIRADDSGLLKYLRGLNPDPDAGRHVKELIAQLGSDEFIRREQTARRLTALAGLALPELQQAGRGNDPEVAQRARTILAEYDASVRQREDILLAVLREVTRRRTPGAVPRLLNTPQVWQRQDFRLAAEKALSGSARTTDRQALRLALKERDEYVRMAAAITLLNQADRLSLPVLGELLDSADLAIRNRAGRVLRAVTRQDHGFAAFDSAGKRARASAAWRKWLEGEGQTARLALPAPAETPLGRVLLCSIGNDRVVELDEDGKKVWEQPYQAAFRCQGLPNGHRLVGSARGRLDEFDAAGRQVWGVDEPGLLLIVAALRRLPNGNTVAVFSGGDSAMLVEFRPDKSICRELLLEHPGCIELLDNGHTLRALYFRWQVQELDRRGKVCWMAENLPWPHSVQRLANGNTLVCVGEREDKVVELDRQGKVLGPAKAHDPRQGQRLPNRLTVHVNEEGVVAVDAAGKVRWQFRERKVTSWSAY